MQSEYENSESKILILGACAVVVPLLVLSLALLAGEFISESISTFGLGLALLFGFFFLLRMPVSWIWRIVILLPYSLFMIRLMVGYGLWFVGTFFGRWL